MYLCLLKLLSQHIAGVGLMYSGNIYQVLNDYSKQVVIVDLSYQTLYTSVLKNENTMFLKALPSHWHRTQIRP